MTPLHAMLTEAADIAAAVLGDIMPRSVTVESGHPPVVALREADFRRLAAGCTVKAYGWDERYTQCNLEIEIGGVRIYTGTAERLSGAVVLDAEGRTVLVQGERRTA